MEVSSHAPILGQELAHNGPVRQDDCEQAFPDEAGLHNKSWIEGSSTEIISLQPHNDFVFDSNELNNSTSLS